MSDISVENGGAGGVGNLFQFSSLYHDWIDRWKDRCRREDTDVQNRQKLMYSVNPIYIPRNHIVEKVISVATDDSDYCGFNELVETLSQPYVQRPGLEYYATPPTDDEIVSRTFCGT